MKIKQIGFTTEIKALSEEKDDSGVSFGFFEGYAATFGNIDKVEDRIEKGAFSGSIKDGHRIKLLWQHFNSELIGQITDAKEDDHGLFIKGRINLGTKQGQEAHALLKAGDIDEMSIGFSMGRGDFEFDDDDIRVIKRVDLREISLVTNPANDKALVTDVKQINDAIDEADSLKDMEGVLQDKGFSRKQSCGVVSKIKKFLSEKQGDPVKPEKIAEKQPDQSESEKKDAVQILSAALTHIELHKTITHLKR